MSDGVVPWLDFIGHVRQADLAAHATEVYRSHGEPMVVVHFDDAAGNSQTHISFSWTR